MNTLLSRREVLSPSTARGAGRLAVSLVAAVAAITRPHGGAGCVDRDLCRTAGNRRCHSCVQPDKPTLGRDSSTTLRDDASRPPWRAFSLRAFSVTFPCHQKCKKCAPFGVSFDRPEDLDDMIGSETEPLPSICGSLGTNDNRNRVLKMETHGKQMQSRLVTQTELLTKRT